MSVESKRKTEHLYVKEVSLYKVLWDTRYDRPAHTLTFSCGLTFGMLRKFWKLQDLSAVPRNNCGQLQKSLHHKEGVFISQYQTTTGFLHEDITLTYSVFLDKTVVGPVLSYRLDRT